MMNIRRKGGLELELGLRQLAMKSQKSNSWYHTTNQIANIYGLPNMYGLPNCYIIFEEPPWSKALWKVTVKRALDDYQLNAWKEKLARLSTLNMLNPKTISVGSPHPVYSTAGNSVNAVKQSISKVRFLADTVLTGEKLENMFDHSPS